LYSGIKRRWFMDKALPGAFQNDGRHSTHSSHLVANHMDMKFLHNQNLHIFLVQQKRLLN